MAIYGWVTRIGKVVFEFLGVLIKRAENNKEDLLSIGGILIFGIQLGINAHFQVPVMDEGLYLYKGLLFVSGRYHPFQDYGPLTNQMPFAFLIPGIVQFLFGPGLRVGRYFAILLGLLMITGLWLTSRRLTNPKIAAVSVWAMVLTPVAAKVYSMAISEGLIACLLVWVMALTLGEKRKLWQLVLGSILAGFILMIRINLLPLLPLLCLYILWQNGWKSAAWATLACVLTVVIGHAFYWPNILRLWAYWLPESLVPFLKAWRPPLGALPFWNPAVSLTDRLSSLTEGIRFYFVPMVGALTACVLWPRKTAWKSPVQFRISVFLSVLFFSLLVLHAWASLSQNYCVYCFPIYTSFYAPLGLLLVVLTITSWQTRLDRWRQIVSGLAIIFVFSIIGYSFIPTSFINTVKKLPVPRIRSMHLLPGNAELWRVISNKFHLDLDIVSIIFSIIIPVFFGVLCCGMSLLIVRWLMRHIKRITINTSAGALVLIFLVLAGWTLSLTAWLDNGYHRYDCTADVIAAEELVGKTLQEVIRPQAKIFWRGKSPVTLLYLPQAKIYPAQLNGDYSYRLGGDPDELLRYGWWDESLGRKWVKDANYIIVAQNYYNSWLKDALESGDYQEVFIYPGTTESISPTCLGDVYPQIFMKKP
jgi:hypothetical protein